MPPSYPAGSYPAKVVADGAVAYWRLGETSGLTAVDVIGGANGTISGGVTLGQAGALSDGDKAMLFDGSTGVVTVPNGSYQAIGTGALTVECWFKTAVTQGPADRFMVDNHDGGTGAGFHINLDASRIHWAIANGTTYHDAIFVIAYADSQWHQLVCVVTRGAPDRVLLYYDGAVVVDQASTISGASLTTPQNYRIGSFISDGGSSNRHFNGVIDDVAIYKTALTAQQIAAHYAARTWTAFGPAYQEMRYRWCRYVAGQARR